MIFTANDLIKIHNHKPECIERIDIRFDTENCMLIEATANVILEGISFSESRIIFSMNGKDKVTFANTFFSEIFEDEVPEDGRASYVNPNHLEPRFAKDSID